MSTPWRFVVGHWPIVSAVMYKGVPALRQKLMPVLERRDVLAYFSGHAHALQHIEPVDSCPLTPAEPRMEERGAAEEQNGEPVSRRDINSNGNAGDLDSGSPRKPFSSSHATDQEDLMGQAMGQVNRDTGMHADYDLDHEHGDVVNGCKRRQRPHHFVSGGGGGYLLQAARTLHVRPGYKNVFVAQSFGFLAVDLRGRVATFEFVDGISGKVLHSYSYVAEEDACGMMH
eukprot:Opistho-2@96645